MKKIIILLIFLTSCHTFSQKAKVTYIASTSNYMEGLKTKKNHTKYLNDIKNALDIEYILYINKNKSYYKKEKSLKVEGNSINMTSVLGGGIYYYNISNNKNLEQKSSRLGDFLIEYEKLNWKLTNETKKIGKYTCLKATSIIIRKRLDAYVERKIIAWYTPEIALNFGPKNFNGLPGLILSLEEGGKLYLVAKNIDLNSKEDVVIPEPPKDYEPIMYKEYAKIISKRFADFRKKRKRRN